MDGDLDALVMDLQSRIIPDPLAVVRDTDNPQEMLLKGNERAVDLGGVPNHQIVGDAFRSISQTVVSHQKSDTVFRLATIALMRSDRARYNTRHNYDEIANSEYLDRLEKSGEAVGWDVIQAAADFFQARIVETFANGSIMRRETIPHDGQVVYEIDLLSKHSED
ncbi:hypothetical protein Tco_1440019 [Tanacetum coccineum]